MIYTKQINEIEWNDVESFCDQQISEGAFLDYKLDFPQNLEKTIAAMANTFGGVIIIGIDESDENKPIVPISGITLMVCQELWAFWGSENPSGMGMDWNLMLRVTA